MWGVGVQRIQLASLIAGHLLLVQACAGTDRQPGASLPADCIMVRTISDFDALDANDLLIYGPAGSAYHVVLASPSIGIEDEFAIGVYDDGDGRLCPYGRDAILIEGVLNEEIRIRSIESLDEAALEALRVEFGDEEAATVEPEQIL